MTDADEPKEIRIRLGGRAAPRQTLDPSLRQLVEEMVRRAYARARVVVSIDLPLHEDLVAVVGDPSGTHRDAVRKLVTYARAKHRAP